jgi:WD40 repeat protein
MGLQGIFSPDSSRLISMSQKGEAKIWDIMTGKELFTLTGTGGLISLALSPDCDNLFNWCGAQLATVGRNETVVWDISPVGSSELLTIPGIGGEFSPDGKSVVTFLPLYLDPDIKLSIQAWNITPEMLGTVELSHTLDLAEWPEAVFISKDMSKAAWQTYDKYITIFDLVNGIQMITFPLDQIAYSKNWETILAINPDFTRLATMVGNTIQIWDATSGRNLRDLPDDTGTISKYVYSLDGKFLAVAEGEINESTAGGDCYIHILETDTYSEISSWLAHDKYIYDLAFSPDGTHLASSSMDMTAKLWRLPAGEELLTMRGHAASIFHVIFNHDGTLLATLGADNTTNLWDAVTGQNILTLPHNARFISFSPDGKYFANADWSYGGVRIYMVDINELADLARSRLTRGLTQEECQQYLHVNECPVTGP